MNRSVVACHICDALSRDHPAVHGERVRCPRCGAVLRTMRSSAIDHLLALSLSVIPLMVVGLTMSFLSLSGGGAHKEASVLDAAIAVATTDLWMLSVLVGVLIVGLPVLRAVALCYVLVPLRLSRPPARHAKPVFRLAIRLRPWSMTEIFVIGVAVALVKVSGLAVVTLGPAFWSLVLLGVVILVEDAVLCERSVWDLIS